jgi:hypothetical protein
MAFLWLRGVAKRPRPVTVKGALEGTEAASATLTRIGPR